MKYLALILFVLVATAYTGCGGGHGLVWTFDGVTHTISWHGAQ